MLFLLIADWWRASGQLAFFTMGRIKIRGVLLLTIKGRTRFTKNGPPMLLRREVHVYVFNIYTGYILNSSHNVSFQEKWKDKTKTGLMKPKSYYYFNIIAHFSIIVVFEL